MKALGMLAATAMVLGVATGDRNASPVSVDGARTLLLEKALEVIRAAAGG